ncbi:chemotaxis protein MotB [Halovulum dunhuangense]|uniref:Chemotaxis protein MotB n=1 Tax=Halovulum dunhuangense TaxID=1505036 RepID=A0A849KZ58_9RHOB|nr:flagellar motor protein MotB [Halovulum dunhuangense]NNU79272.1 chemotaxis protein MotB [Halovulum dunhuangense]
MAEEGARPIIVRRKKAAEASHHGGAWKVAYADFVTAMMAFFLLMWLLNATTEDQRKGLADYFNPSIPVHRTSGGGDGPFGGSSALSEDVMAQAGKGATRDRPAAERQASGQTGVEADPTSENRVEDAGLDGIAEALLARGGESEIADRLLEHVRMRRTDEGLVIELAELPVAPLFEGDSALPTSRMLDLVQLIVPVLGLVTNAVALDAHLEQGPIIRPELPGWELTAARAIAMRGLLSEAGVDPVRFARVTGEADRAPARADPRDIRNRRVEIILLTDRGTPAP